MARVVGDGVADDDDLTGADGVGFDSVRVVELLLGCEERFGVDLPAEELLSTPLTIRRLAERVARERR